MAKIWMISDPWELKIMIGVMEDPIDENKDDNVWSMVEKLEERKTKLKLENQRDDQDFVVKIKKKFEQMRKIRK